MSEQPTGIAPGIAVGARVRERDWPIDRSPRMGTVVDTPHPDPHRVSVWWDDLRLPLCVPELVPCWSLEVIAPSPARPKAKLPQYPAEWLTGEQADRAPERIHPDGSRMLAPHVWQHSGRRGGIPCVEGRRIDCETIYGQWEGGVDRAETLAEWDITESQYVAAVAFEAGVRWAKERRKAKRKAKA